MSELKKAEALAKKYAKAGIPLTDAEKNRLAFLRKQHLKVQDHPRAKDNG
jgi:uncharacterized protein YnzC (UPF0291/DUF896 family)